MRQSKQTKYIFITGGVISSLGKGIVAASLGRILKGYGYSVTAIKCDMYVNIDAGTMRPTEHGEVYVTKDGVECDQDLGNYERFLGTEMNWTNYTTTGQIYQEVIRRERNLEYDGEDVEVVPHVPEEIIRRIKLAGVTHTAEIVIVEIGGTVGEYQNILFLEADRMMKRDLKDNVINVHVSYLPIPKTVGEMKSKPVQYSVRTLNAAGIQPEIVVGRAEIPIDEKRKEKIAIFCSVDKRNVFSSPDVESVYELPVILENQHVGERILELLNLKKRKEDLKDWRTFLSSRRIAKKSVRIGIVGKYFTTGDFALEDSYISVIEAIKHASWKLGRRPDIQWIGSEQFEREPKSVTTLRKFDGIIVPGGFGKRGVEGKIRAIEFVRKHNIPYFGLCYGLQLAVVEFARNVLTLKHANTTEIDQNTPHPVIHTMEDQIEHIQRKHFGGSMRLGDYPCKLKPSTIAHKSYKRPTIIERHRHRYEVNNEYRDQLEASGFVVSGQSPNNKLVEVMELINHPWFVGTQFHPEFLSRPLDPHPLFLSFIRACIKHQSQ